MHRFTLPLIYPGSVEIVIIHMHGCKLATGGSTYYDESPVVVESEDDSESAEASDGSEADSEPTDDTESADASGRLAADHEPADGGGSSKD